MSGGAREPGRSVVSRLVAVLGAFAVDHEELTLTTISGRSDLPMATTRRLLAELTSERLVERLPSGRYRIGLKLWEIGSHAVRRNALRQVAIPAMRDLYNLTHENILLAVPDNGQVLYIERISGARSAPSKTAVGSRWPLHATAAGKALLAHMNNATVRDILSLDLVQLTPNTIVQPGLLAKALAKVRSAGVSFSYGEDEVGLVGLGVPIFDQRHVVAVAALAVVGRWAIGVERITPVLRSAGKTVSGQLQSAMEGRETDTLDRPRS